MYKYKTSICCVNIRIIVNHYSGVCGSSVITRDGISSHRLKWLRHNRMCATPSVYLDEYGRDDRTTSARLQIERDSIRQVIVNNKKLQPV